MKKDEGIESNVTSDIPTDALEALARCLYPAMVAYYESGEGQAEFAKWQEGQGGQEGQDGQSRGGANSPAEGGATETAVSVKQRRTWRLGIERIE